MAFDYWQYHHYRWWSFYCCVTQPNYFWWFPWSFRYTNSNCAV